jgi:hypothetical protein
MGALPIVSADRFTRNFGDEFFCIRRPEYYALVYAGHPMGEWQKAHRPGDPRKLPRKLHPRNGGGLCMFWSPAFGSSILGKNWSAYSAHTLITETRSKTDWDDYWSIQSEFEDDPAVLTITGAIRDQPLQFRRAYRFLDDRVECELTIKATGPVDLDAMWECFPYPLDKAASGPGMRVSPLNARGGPVRDGPASAIQFSSAGSPQAHLIVFNQPRRCEIGTDESVDPYGQARRHGRVLAELPSRWTAGQTHTIRWMIKPTARHR